MHIDLDLCILYILIHQNFLKRFSRKILRRLIILNVLDLVSQFRDVVLVMCIFSSGKPQGVGILERGVYGEGDGNGEISFTSNLGPRWTGSYHSKEGSK
jgi:hypothetical protein